MTKQEFQERTNLQVTDEKFDEINNIYMACPDIQKDEFCDLYVNDKDSLMRMMAKAINKMEVEATNYINTMEVLREKIEDDAFLLLNLACKYNDESIYDIVVKRLGMKRIITHKLCEDMELNASEKDYILNIMAKQ